MDRRSRPADRLRVGLLVLTLTLVLGACFGSSSSPSPSSPPTPSPTPDPHLREPVRVGEVYRILRDRGLNVVGTNAKAGTDPVTTIVATYGGWPLKLAEYTSTHARMQAVPFENREVPKKGMAPYLFAGLNLAVEFGPAHAGTQPPAPDNQQLRAATSLANELNRLVGPIGQRSVVPVEVEAIARPATSQSPAPPSESPAD